MGILQSSGSHFILKPPPRPDGKIIFAPLDSFDVMFFVLTSLISIAREEKLAPPIENRCYSRFRRKATTASGGLRIE